MKEDLNNLLVAADKLCSDINAFIYLEEHGENRLSASQYNKLHAATNYIATAKNLISSLIKEV